MSWVVFQVVDENQKCVILRDVQGVQMDERQAVLDVGNAHYQ